MADMLTACVIEVKRLFAVLVLFHLTNIKNCAIFPGCHEVVKFPKKRYKKM